MTKEEFLKLSDFDKLRYAIKESLEEHKKYTKPFWEGSRHMAESILISMETIEKNRV